MVKRAISNSFAKVAQWRLVDAWVSKPIDSNALKESIKQAIEKRQSSGRK